MNAIKKACFLVGGQARMAELLQVSPQAVSKWVIRGRAPAQRVLEVEAHTACKVSRHDLRPDIYGAEAAMSAGSAVINRSGA